MDESSDLVSQVRSLNRFYTREIGVLREGLHNSPFPLPERVYYELANQTGITAGDLGHQLEMDQGYVSRTIAKLARSGFVARTRSERDARQWHLSLTENGRRAAAQLDQASQEEIGALLGRLKSTDQSRLVASMTTIQELLMDLTEPEITLLNAPDWGHGLDHSAAW